MPTARSTARRGAALVAATAIAALTASTALAHPESEGSHAGTCIVTAEPGTVAAGGQFTVAGNFGNASIWVLPGANATVGEDQTPTATSPAGGNFSITFTALGPGELTIFAAIEGSECGDTDHVTVTGTLPNTATPATLTAPIVAGLTLLLAAVAFAMRRTASPLRR